MTRLKVDGLIQIHDRHHLSSLGTLCLLNGNVITLFAIFVFSVGVLLVKNPSSSLRQMYIFCLESVEFFFGKFRHCGFRVALLSAFFSFTCELLVATDIQSFIEIEVVLVLFLFLVGLETDLRFLISNWRVAASVSAAGMILPFGLGSAISYGLYHTFRTEPGMAHIDFGTYLLFIGIAMAITVGVMTSQRLMTTTHSGRLSRSCAVS